MGISLEQAGKIAAQTLRTKIAASAHWSQYEFGEVSLWKETEAFWVFFTRSERLIDEGHAPGGLSVCVDKNDGHLLSDQEEEQYYETRARRQTEPTSAAA